jgi:peptidoglycan/xylan/chitin deacetylase (PgdA/CDA1 family)
MIFRSQLGAVRSGILSSLCRRVALFPESEPIISFTFDDFPRTALAAGGTILEAFGACGTYYTAASLMNGSSEIGDHFTADDLSAVLRRGHEIGNHTFSHSSSRSLSSRAFCADVEKGKQALEKLADHSADNFCYPYGHVTLGTKRALSSHVTSARGTYTGFNGPDVDLNLLRANRLYGDMNQAPRLHALILENVQRKTWLIFYTHDVRPQPSPYGCTPALFESVVSCAARSGSRLLTIQQALGQFGVGVGNPYPEAHLAALT